MPTFGSKNKKNENDTELNVIHEQNDMEIEGMLPPAPDSENQIQNQVVQIDNQNEIHLNEEALKELIKKEEDNLTKKNKDKIKNLDEIKKDIDSLNASLNLSKLKIYEDQFYSDLKKQISE